MREEILYNYNMKKIEPFNKVWLNCYNNLMLSLLTSVDSSYETYGFENQYKYYVGNEISGGGVKFNYLTVNQDICNFETFSTIEEKNFSDEKEFKACIVQHLCNKDGFVLIYVDLHDWLEGSICWKKFHWEHYSLLVDYDKDTRKVIAFDELNGKYVKFQVYIDELFNHLSKNNHCSQIRLVTLKKAFSLPKLDMKNYVYNAKKIINNIDAARKNEFWLINEYDFKAHSHMELNGVYLQRIEGRQEANKKMLEEFMNKSKEHSREGFKELCNGFSLLVDKWRNIRFNLFKAYFDDNNRAMLLEQINWDMKKALLHEKKIWQEFVKVMEE